MYEYVGAMLSDVTLARSWLLQMGEGAAQGGLTIQYCMPFIRHLLQSLEVAAVTQVGKQAVCTVCIDIDTYM